MVGEQVTKITTNSMHIIQAQLIYMQRSPLLIYAGENAMDFIYGDFPINS